MTVRSLDLLDLPFLSRYRQDVLALDTGRMLTRGNPIGARAMLSYLNPKRQMYTAVASENGMTLMGQVILHAEETSARLTFIAPAHRINGMTLPLLDELIRQAGEWGALHILAEVNEDSNAYAVIRQAGFTIYAWQRAWKLPGHPLQQEQQPWREAHETDWIAIHSLYGQIVPALLQPVEMPPREVTGLVCCQKDGLQAFSRVDQGTQGIWLQPLVHPDSSCTVAQLIGLGQAMKDTGTLPVFMCVRSYQAWLEPLLEELGAEAGPRQAILVRRLATTIKETQPIKTLQESMAKVKPTASVSRLVEHPGTDTNHDG